MPSAKGYGQFCPVAKAAEVVAERWTPLVLRELIAGSRRFNDLRRGVPLMSSALLSQRLKELEHAGVVERKTNGKNTEYHLSQAGLELGPIIAALGNWGARWTRSRLTRDDYDASLLMWDMRRGIDVQRLPSDCRTVIEFNLSGADPVYRRWWMVIEHGEVDLCHKDPGYDVDLVLNTELKTLIEVWMGHEPVSRLAFEGKPALALRFRASLRLSSFSSDNAVSLKNERRFSS